jgi:hypothetical protein
MNSEISTVLSAVPSCQKKKNPDYVDVFITTEPFVMRELQLFNKKVAAARTAFSLIVTYSYRRRCFSDMVYVTPNN